MKLKQQLQSSPALSRQALGGHGQGRHGQSRVAERDCLRSDRDCLRWGALALSALLAGTLMAMVLVLAKVPLLAEMLKLDGVFYPALTYHVNLSILFWVGLGAVLLWTHCWAPCWKPGDRLAQALVVLALVLLATSLVENGPVRLSNYLPLRASLSFIGGLSVFATAVTLVFLNRLPAALTGLWRSPVASHWLAALAGLAWLAALAVLLRALQAPAADVLAADFVLWGAGHLLQAFNLLLLAAVWCAFSNYRPGYFSRRLMQTLALGALVSALLIAFFWPPDSSAYRSLFTQWMRVFSVPLLLVMLPGLLWRVGSPGRMKGQPTSASRILGFSMGLVLLGALLGAAIRADNLLVPAHYHAMTGALNLMLMAQLARTLSGSLSQVIGVRLQLYAAGVLLLVVGLAGAGWMGVGRKLSGEAQGLEGMLAQGLMVLTALGGLVAVVATLQVILKLAANLRQSYSAASLPGIQGAGP